MLREVGGAPGARPLATYFKDGVERPQVLRAGMTRSPGVWDSCRVRYEGGED